MEAVGHPPVMHGLYLDLIIGPGMPRCYQAVIARVIAAKITERLADVASRYVISVTGIRC